MNRIDVSYNGEDPFPWEKKLVVYVEKVLDYIGKHNWEVSIVFGDDSFIRKLNNDYREKDEPTDVLSFCQEDGESGEVFYAGDIVISVESVKRNASRFNVDTEEELRRVVIHGILHLSGLDHASNDPSEPMLEKQELILKTLEGEKLF